MKEQIKKLTSAITLGTIALAFMTYINLSTHSKLPASTKKTQTESKVETNFVKTSLIKTAEIAIENTCHVVYTSLSQDVCYNTEPWFGYCWAPDEPGPC